MKLHLILTVVVLGLSAAPTHAQNQTIERESLARIQEWTRMLIYQLDQLDDDFGREIAGDARKRDYDAMSNAAIASAMSFQNVLRSGAPRDQVQRRYRDLDAKVNTLMTEIDKLPNLNTNKPMIRRSARSIRYSGEQLNYMVAMAEGSGRPEEQLRESLLRQTRSLERSSQELTQVILGLPNHPHLQAVKDAMKDFDGAADQFRGKVERNTALPALRREFVGLDKAWHRAADLIAEMPPRLGYLVRTRAEQIDNAHERLHRLLGVDGDRTPLTFKEP